MLCVGSLALNDTVYADGRTSMGDAGGNALYAAVGARIWSDDVAISAVIGADWPAEHTERLRAGGIDLDALQTHEGETLRAWTIYESCGRRRYLSRNTSVIGLTPNPFRSAPLSEREADEYARAARGVHVVNSPRPSMSDMFDSCGAIHVAPMQLETILEWLHAAQGRDVLVSLDIPPFPPGTTADDPALVEVLSHVFAFMPSEAEVETIAGGFEPEAFCRAMAAHGPQIVVIKRGESGASVFDRESDTYFEVGAHPADVNDLTGAGDAFCGGFMAGYLATSSVHAATRHGTVAASHVIEGFGGLHTLAVPRAVAEKRLVRITSPQDTLPKYCCAILRNPDGRLLLEQRDDRAPNAPGQLTCFGGRREPGERPMECLRRELNEELAWVPSNVTRAVDLWVGDTLVAWFFVGDLDVPLDALTTEPRRRAILADPDHLPESTLSRWHLRVIEAWRRGERRVDLPAAHR